MAKTRYIKKVVDVAAYRLTRPEGNNRTVAILLDRVMDGSQNLSMGLCIIDPKSQIPYHMHENEEEAMFILRGKGKAKIEEDEYSLSEASVMFCPPRTRHQIINRNDQELWFIFLYAPQGPEQGVKTAGIPTEPITVESLSAAF